MLNLDATSANQLHVAAEKEGSSMGDLVLRLVQSRGKCHNPVTNSGGVLIGRVLQCGSLRQQRLSVGSLIVPLCSLTALPLNLRSVRWSHGHQMRVEGTAILYDSIVAAVLEEPLPLPMPSLVAAIDVSRLVPHLRRLLQEQHHLTVDTKKPFVVACMGCGRSGLLAMAVVHDAVPGARIIALDRSVSSLKDVLQLGIPNTVVEECDATKPLDVLQAVNKHAPEGADLVLNLVSVQGTEAGTSLIAKKGGTIVYFSMATNFSRATLSTDVTGNPLRVELGAGVFPDQASSTIDLLKRYPKLAAVFNAEPLFYEPMVQSTTTMRRFANFVGMKSASYATLHKWSIENVDQFWESLWKFFNVPSFAPWTRVRVANGPLMAQCTWFPGARVNHAQLLMRHCKATPEKTAIVAFGEAPFRREALTYEQLESCVSLAQQALIRLGVTKGSVVAAILPNCTSATVAMLAATALGATWTALGPDLGINVVVSRFEQVKPSILLVCPAYQYGGKRFNRIHAWQEVVAALPTVRHVVSVPHLDHDPAVSIPSSWLRWKDLLNESDPKNTTVVFVPMEVSDPVYIMYTSGTTGPPKCIVQGFGVSLNHLKEHGIHFNVGAEDIVFVYSSLSWVMWTYHMGMLALGSTLVVFDGSPFHPKTETFWTDVVLKERVTYWFTSARYLDAIRKANYIPDQDNQLKLISSTGSTLAPETSDYFHRHLPNVILASGSGGTEVNGSLALYSSMLPVFGGGELPAPPLGMDVDVLDPATQKRIVDVEGELACFTPAPCMPLYFVNDSDSKRYKKAYFEQGPNVWIHGDWAIRTRRGGFFILGRSDATLNPGGVRIGTRDYYSLVEQLPGVADSIVVGIPNSDNTDEDVVLFIVLRPGFALDAEMTARIRSEIRTKLSPKHIPKQIVAVSGVPVNLNMKKMEILVKQIVTGKTDTSSTPLVNPECLKDFIAWRNQRKSKL